MCGLDFGKQKSFSETEDMIRYINFKLSAMNHPYYTENTANSKELSDNGNFIHIAENLIQDFREKSRLLSDYLCPADRRIRNFLKNYTSDENLSHLMKLPHQTFILDRYGLSRIMSLAPDKNKFKNEYINSYRIKQGILHNPLHDRRTTKGSFHIVEGGLPVPLDKKEVPVNTFAALFNEATNPPGHLTALPYTSSQNEQANLFVSLLIRPTVSPEVENVIKEKSMEIRFFVPGSLVSSLDFIESIFGNAGDPFLIRNDAALDVEHWSGHTGCIILAPHLTKMKKKEMGLPTWEKATERQKKEGMCWKDESEIYNDGVPFKITCRNSDGIAVTIIADNYFGYSKKEIKTQISYAANLLGLCEEEHSGGAVAFPRKSMGRHINPGAFTKKYPHTFDEMKENFHDIMDLHPENYGIDKKYPSILYIPENSEIDLYKKFIKWQYNGNEQTLKLLPEHYYVFPSGHKIHMEKHAASPAWKLISTHPNGTFCHKPCTVSGGGKSEISKSLSNAIIYTPFYIHNIADDLEQVKKIINYDYRNRWKKEPSRERNSRLFLSMERSLGSVIKLLTPSQLYTDEHNEFLQNTENHIKALALYVKRFYKVEWGDNWQKYFSVDVVNGRPGHALIYSNRKIMPSHLRVGFVSEDSWFLHKLRTDFMPSAKIQMEDDISATITIPADQLENICETFAGKSVKFVKNCEFRFFQRPDEAIKRGYDIQAESDLSSENNFISNYEPLTPENAKELIEDAIGFYEYTQPIQQVILDGVAAAKDTFFISSSHPRIIDGKRSENPRYLQVRPDFTDPIDYYIAKIGVRFNSRISPDKPLYLPVDSVLPGRRNNPPNKKEGIKALSVYNPIHYQELPELFMDFICSLTGKSPSTTGAGSEGALTKGPFNMLTPTSDLNNSLLSFILTGYNGYSSAAGFVGVKNRFDHDISILMPELWCRLKKSEKDPKRLIDEGSLEKLEDFERNGERIFASRLGYRITSVFLFRYLGRIFDEPQAVFSEDMLKPELQDEEAFVDGIKNIVEAQQKSARLYFEDGSIDSAIPPLKILLHIMTEGVYEGKPISDPELRKQFSREVVLSSDWYHERLLLKQKNDIIHWQKSIRYISDFISQKINLEISSDLELNEKLEFARKELENTKSDNYLKKLYGTIGSDPLYRKD